MDHPPVSSLLSQLIDATMLQIKRGEAAISSSDEVTALQLLSAGIAGASARLSKTPVVNAIDVLLADLLVKIARARRYREFDTMRTFQQIAGFLLPLTRAHLAKAIEAQRPRPADPPDYHPNAKKG